MTQQSTESLLIEDAVFRLQEESLARIRTCVNAVDDEECWHRSGLTTVSMGNLLLHLEGNVRQWILGGLAGHPVERNRPREFSPDSAAPKDDVFKALEATVKEAVQALQDLPPNALNRRYCIQGFEVTGVSALVHVVEHFSYHTGQITYMVKSRKHLDTGYYQQDLDQP